MIICLLIFNCYRWYPKCIYWYKKFNVNIDIEYMMKLEIKKSWHLHAEEMHRIFDKDVEICKSLLEDTSFFFISFSQPNFKQMVHFISDYSERVSFDDGQNIQNFQQKHSSLYLDNLTDSIYYQGGNVE